MALRVALAALPLVSAISFPAPEPTLPPSVSDPPSSTLPHSTPRLSASPRVGILRRRDEFSTSTQLDNTESRLCGFEAGIYDYCTSQPSPFQSHSNLTPQDSRDECIEGYTCMYHAPDPTYAGLIGCCSEGQDCGFATTCYGAAQVSETPDLTRTQKAFTKFCTESTADACWTYIFPDASATDFLCFSETGLTEAYTTGVEPTGSASGTVVIDHKLFLSTADAALVKAYEDSWSTGSDTPSASASASATPSSDSDSDSDSNSTPAGPIAGGVVGGVAGVALLGGAAFFLLRKRKGKGDAPKDYSTVPDTHSMEQMQQQQQQHYAPHYPAEMESSDPATKYPEIQGDLPGDRASTLPMGVKQEMNTDTEVRGQQKHFLAELPADSVRGKHT
ncbi:hypothetical protein BDV18DRAFT_155289 [Aspergillus unguis]